MNTDHDRVDFHRIDDAFSALSKALSIFEIGSALEIAALGLGLPNYLAVEVVEMEPQANTVLHNLERLRLEEVMQQQLTARLIATRFPEEIAGGLRIDELTCGVAASAPRGHTTCLIFMGRASGALAVESLTDRLGSVSLIAPHVLDAIDRLRRAACPLSARELQCLCLATNGYSAKETARQLGISHRTVEDYLANCRARLNASTTMAATLQALRKGWISFADIDAATSGCVSHQSREGRRN